MKKLMFVAAVLAAGLTQAESGIASANIVGFQSKATLGNSYFKFVVPTFNSVLGTMKLGDIKLDYEGDGAGSQILWTLDLGGATKDDYYYVNAAASATEEVPVGWYTDTTFKVPADDVEIPFGQGFALVAASDTTKVVFAGQVENQEFASVVGGGIFNFTGNFMPVDYTLGDIALIYDGDMAGSQILWILDIGGATKDAYYYVNEAAAVTEEVPVGWYTDTTFKTSANKVSLSAGDGFAIVAGSAIQLKVPSPVKGE